MCGEMAAETVKIVLDADVIIHFAKGGMLHALPSIFPEYEFVVLDIVVREVHQPTLHQLQNQMSFLKNIKEVTFGSSSEERREYARLTSEMGLGRGESACMVYCRFNKDVVGSSNLRDITDYCDQYRITYLTTIDFLYYGIQRGVFAKADAEEFVRKVNSQGSRLPVTDFDRYVCNKL